MKKTEHRTLHSVWNDSRSLITKEKTQLDIIQYNEFVSSLFCPGPFCFFVVDFYDMQIVSVSPNFRDVIYAPYAEISFDSILAGIHPDDMSFVAAAEKAAIDYMYNIIGRDKVVKYKITHCHRARGLHGDYKMFLRQGIILTVDQSGGFGKCLNILTDISHITSINNYKLSLIGMDGEPSIYDVETGYNITQDTTQIFTNREIEIVKMIADGLQSKDIAGELNLSLHTVNTHRKNILSKSGEKSMTKLISRCIQEGLF